MPNTDQSWRNLRDLICRNLGDGLVDVELTPEQGDDAIDQALREFRMRSASSVKEGWMFLEAQKDQRIYSIPSYVVDVFEIERMNLANFNSFTQLQFSNFLYYNLSAGQPFDLATFHLERSFLEDLELLAASKISFRFHPGLDGSQIGNGPGLASTPPADVPGAPSEASQVPSTRPTGSRMVDVPAGRPQADPIQTPDKEMEWDNRLRLEGPHIELLTRPRGQDEVLLLNLAYSRTDAELIQDRETSRWIEGYAEAEAMIKLGRAYRKFQNIPGPAGGFSLPGSEYIQDGKDKKEKLEQELLDYLHGNELLLPIFGPA